MMKKQDILLAACMGAAGLIAGGCDNVGEGERYIDYPLPEASKTELIMEFTGQSCINCPNGAKVIHQLQESYPDNIIAVAMHPEDTEYTRPVGPDLGLTSKTASEVYTFYKPTSFPYAVFDGKVYPNSQFYLQWTEVATQLVNEETPVVLAAEASYDSSRNITVNAKASFVRGNYKGGLNIAVWIMENGIIGDQKGPSGKIRNYEHNHVLRTSLNGTWGQLLGTDFQIEDVREYTASLAVADSSWELSNCQAVVFLCDPVSKRVVQASLADLEPAD